MFANSRQITHSLSLFKRAYSTKNIETLLAEGEQLIKVCKFSDAKQIYKEIMEKFPARHEGYDGYYYTVACTSGIFGPSQRLFNHLQNKYLEAVERENQRGFQNLNKHNL